MPFTATTATRKILKLDKRIRAVQGGTSASKTISILLRLINDAQADEEKTLTSIVSESLPHLKRGAMRDFLNIMKEHNYYEDSRWNRTNYTYSFETGSEIEFFSADQPDKLRGARRDRLYINECNNVPYEAYDQLEVRTKECIYLDWNPTAEFWFYTEILGKRDDVDHITLTYLDNEALDQQIIEAIEQRKANKMWWQVYGLGQLGEVEGRIFTGWNIIDELPHEARLERYGLDFGYTNDPTAIVGVYKYNEGLILDEKLYQKGLLNKQIADNILNFEDKALIIADSSEPKSIDEIRLFGINIIGATKGRGSVNHGIDLMQEQRISVTKQSVNLIKEYRNYMWATDKLGKSLNTPEDVNNHALDSARYAIQSIFRTRKDTKGAQKPRVRPVFDEIGV